MTGSRETTDKSNGFKLFDSTQNHFENKKYKNHTQLNLMKLLDLYQNTAEVKEILAKTNVFLQATTLDEYAKSLRDNKINNDEALILTIQNIANAVQDAEVKCDREKGNEKLFPIYSSAINYCIKTIKKHLKQLEKQHDHVFDIFTQCGDDTKNLLTKSYKNKIKR